MRELCVKIDEAQIKYLMKELDKFLKDEKKHLPELFDSKGLFRITRYETSQNKGKYDFNALSFYFKNYTYDEMLRWLQDNIDVFRQYSPKSTKSGTKSTSVKTSSTKTSVDSVKPSVNSLKSSVKVSPKKNILTNFVSKDDGSKLTLDQLPLEYEDAIGYIYKNIDDIESIRKQAKHKSFREFDLTGVADYFFYYPPKDVFVMVVVNRRGDIEAIEVISNEQYMMIGYGHRKTLVVFNPKHIDKSDIDVSDNWLPQLNKAYPGIILLYVPY